MQLSAEIRWFWKDAAPAGFESWFTDANRHPCPAGGGTPRIDKYLVDPSQIELGIKQRDATPGTAPRGCEVKGLVTVIWGALPGGPLAGRVDVWTKWACTALVLDETLLVPIEKTRRLRKFDTAGADPQEIPLGDSEQPTDPARRGPGLPAFGCHVELTRVKNGGGETWWTFGLEAFGDLQTVQDDLCAVARVLTARGLPAMPGGLLLSYPAWLRDHGR